MVRRGKRLVAVWLVCFMILELVGTKNLEIFAEELLTAADMTIDTTYDDNVVLYSGAVCEVTQTGVVNGDISITSDPDGGQITNYGTINSEKFDVDKNGRVYNYGNIQNVILTGASFQMDSGYVNTLKVASIYNGDLSIPQNITINGGVIDKLLESPDYGSWGTVQSGTITLNGGDIGVLSNNQYALKVTGTVDVAQANVTGFTGSGTVNISDSIQVTDRSETGVSVNVSPDTMITATNANSYISVTCGKKSYLLGKGCTYQSGSLRELYGKTVTIQNVTNNHITQVQGLENNQMYWQGESTAVAQFEAKDGYYFPDDYASGVAVEGGSKTGVKVTRLSYSEIKVQYTIQDTDGDVTIQLAPALEIPEGSGTIKVQDIHYGKTPVPVISSDVYDIKDATVLYKKKTEGNNAYTDKVPTAVGDYTAKVIFPALEYCDGFEATDDFSITYLDAPETPYTIWGTKGLGGYYISDVRVKPPKDYVISDSLDGEYASYIAYDASVSKKRIYLQKVKTGEKTRGILLNLKIDKDMPEVDAKNGKTYYGDAAEVTVRDSHLNQILVNGEKMDISGNVKTLKLSSNNGISDYRIVATDDAGNTTIVKISVAAAWMKTGTLPTGTAVKLVKGRSYKFGSGNWKVSGDQTSYSGSIEFYVKEDGAYTFVQQ